jgi:hypothetical protein
MEAMLAPEPVQGLRREEVAAGEISLRRVGQAVLKAAPRLPLLLSRKSLLR